jgi:REP element-mobilizing transposase RayT
MPRNKRVWYPRAVYHIVSRGNRKSHLFRDQRDYEFYLDILRKIKAKCGFSLLSYCLMTNHIHLQIQTEEVEIWKLMHQINFKYDLNGHVFQGRYFSKLIEDEFYNLGVSRYIHLNPVEASIVIKAEAYNRSSYPSYLGLREDELVNEKSILSSFSNDRVLYRKFVESEEINKELDQKIKNECEL